VGNSCTYRKTLFSEIRCKLIHILCDTIVINGATEETKGCLGEVDFV